jgi:hypothetical protein
VLCYCCPYFCPQHCLIKLWSLLCCALMKLWRLLCYFCPYFCPQHCLTKLWSLLCYFCPYFCPEHCLFKPVSERERNKDSCKLQAVATHGVYACIHAHGLGNASAMRNQRCLQISTVALTPQSHPVGSQRWTQQRTTSSNAEGHLVLTQEGEPLHQAHNAVAGMWHMLCA